MIRLITYGISCDDYDDEVLQTCIQFGKSYVIVDYILIHSIEDMGK